MQLVINQNRGTRRRNWLGILFNIGPEYRVRWILDADMKMLTNKILDEAGHTEYSDLDGNCTRPYSKNFVNSRCLQGIAHPSDWVDLLNRENPSKNYQLSPKVYGILLHSFAELQAQLKEKNPGKPIQQPKQKEIPMHEEQENFEYAIISTSPFGMKVYQTANAVKYDDAIQTAKELAKEEPDSEFHVFKRVATAKVTAPVEVTEY